MENFIDHRDPVVSEKGAFEGELALARGGVSPDFEKAVLP
jgi:hypothetical protein